VETTMQFRHHCGVKKRYNFMHLKIVLSFYDLPEDLKQLKMLAGGNLERGAAGVKL
jgi:hypothetical protein